MASLGRVGYIAGQHFPSKKADTHQVVKTVSALTAEGLDIELVVPRPLGGPSRDALREAIHAYYSANEDLRIRFVTTIPRVKWGVENEIAGFVSPFLPFAREYRLLYVRHWFTLLGIYLSRRPFVYENHRLLQMQYPLRVPIVKHILSRRRALGVVTNAPMVTQAYEDLGIPADRILTAHNGFDPKDMQPRRSRREARAALGLDPGAKIVLYAGNLQPHKGVESLLPVARMTPEVHYLLAGGNAQELAWFRGLIAEFDVSNVTLLGWKDHEELIDYHYAANVLIVPPASTPLHRTGRSTVVPMKLYTYLAAGRPIVAPALEDMKEVLESGSNALLCRPDDPGSCARVIRRVLEDEGLARRLGAQARTDAERYTWRRRARRIIAFLERRTESEKEEGTARRVEPDPSHRAR